MSFQNCTLSVFAGGLLPTPPDPTPDQMDRHPGLGGPAHAPRGGMLQHRGNRPPFMQRGPGE